MILIGTFLIWGSNLFCGKPLSLIDAFFTSTSAVCVTGLSVVDTGKNLVPASQAVLLILIQLGGLGVMTAATFLLLLLRRPIGIRQRILFAGGMGLDGPSGAVRLVARIVKITVVIEGVFAIPLFFGFLKKFPPLKAIWYAVFHSISAFCNAGFSPFTDSLETYSSSILIPGVIMILILLGGSGFVVVSEIYEKFAHGKRCSVHTRLVSLVTLLLILAGTGLLCLSEWNRAFYDMPVFYKIFNGLFAAVTPRTAGFDTVSMNAYSDLGMFIVMILMIIGASPGSTGGGIKTTTFGILVSSAFFSGFGESRLVLWKRSVPNRVVLRAMMLFFMYAATIVVGVLLLDLSESFTFREVSFEVISALGTVGLSTGVTPDLSWCGKMIIILLMFWGRVGILTFMFSVMDRSNLENINYPETFIPVG